MVGNRNDTKESVRDTIDFAKHLGVDFIQVCRTIAKPGTELDQELIKKTGRIIGAHISRVIKLLRGFLRRGLRFLCGKLRS